MRDIGHLFMVVDAHITDLALKRPKAKRPPSGASSPNGPLIDCTSPPPLAARRASGGTARVHELDVSDARVRLLLDEDVPLYNPAGDDAPSDAVIFGLIGTPYDERVSRGRGLSPRLVMQLRLAGWFFCGRCGLTLDTAMRRKHPRRRAYPRCRACERRACREQYQNRAARRKAAAQ